MSGRHPNRKRQLVPIQYATMAIAGTPDGKQKYAPEMAAVYLRLVYLNNDSSETSVTVTLKGQCQMADTPYRELVSADKKQTVLRFMCRDAANFDMELYK